MTGYDTPGADQSPAGQAGTPGTELTPAEKAKNTMVNGVKVLAIGVVGVLIAILGMWTVATFDFPFARLVGLLIIFLLVVSAVMVTRGLLWAVQGATAYAKAPK